MAQSPLNYTINGNLTFNGQVAGNFSVRAQGIAGDLIMQMPNVSPVAGQALIAATVVGNIMTMGWANVPGSNPPVSLSQLQQSGATSGQVIEWNGSAWAPGSISSGVVSVFSRSGAVVATSGDYTVSQVTGAAPLASPTFTGIVTAPTISGLSEINAAHPGGLDITTSDDLIQLQALATGATINVHGDSSEGVELINNTGGSGIFLPDSGIITLTGASVTLPAIVNGTTGQNLTFQAASGKNVNLGSDFGFINLNGSGERFRLQTENASIVVDASGNLALGTVNNNTKITLNPNNLLNINSAKIPGPYANNAAATGAGLVAGDVYYTASDPRTLAIVF